MIEELIEASTMLLKGSFGFKSNGELNFEFKII